ncbi:hypothetical protein [Endozoicomonas atrinae]|uniref:hypothetical protein n=1 Tax=Endozoicomonas atrinae TaxID=1333660 RepID=UPI003B00AA1E
MLPNTSINQTELLSRVQPQSVESPPSQQLPLGYFNCLPVEVIEGIAKKLTLPNVISLKQVCRLTNRSITDNIIDKAKTRYIQNITPEEIDRDVYMDNYAYTSYINDVGSWQTRGTPQPGMTEYSTECKDIDKVFSYQEGENDGDSWIMFGELKDGSVFHFSGSCDYTGFDCEGGGMMIVAPNWEDLFNHTIDVDLSNFVDNMYEDNLTELAKKLLFEEGNLRSSLINMFQK